MTRRPPRSPLFPSTPLFRSISDERVHGSAGRGSLLLQPHQQVHAFARLRAPIEHIPRLHQMRLAAVPVSVVIKELGGLRSEEHTSELQSRLHLACRPLLENK